MTVAIINSQAVQVSSGTTGGDLFMICLGGNRSVVADNASEAITEAKKHEFKPEWLSEGTTEVVFINMPEAEHVWDSIHPLSPYNNPLQMRTKNIQDIGEFIENNKAVAGVTRLSENDYRFWFTDRDVATLFKMTF